MQNYGPGRAHGAADAAPPRLGSRCPRRRAGPGRHPRRRRQPPRGCHPASPPLAAGAPRSGVSPAGPGRASPARRSRDPYSLRVARGPGQAPGLLAEDEDGAGDVVGGALHLVRGQSQELGSPVGEPEGQVRAAAVVGARAASHDAAHEIGHGGLHPREHSTPAGGGSAGAAAQGGERGAPAGSAAAAAAAPAAPAALPQWGHRAAGSRAGERRAQGQPRGRGLIAAAAAGSPLPARRWANSARRRLLLSHVIARLDLPGRFLLLLRHRRTPGTRRARAAPARLPAPGGRPAAGARRAGPGGAAPSCPQRCGGAVSGGRSSPRPPPGRVARETFHTESLGGPGAPGVPLPAGGRSPLAVRPSLLPLSQRSPSRRLRRRPWQSPLVLWAAGQSSRFEESAILLPLKRVKDFFPTNPFARKNNSKYLRRACGPAAVT